MIPVLASIEYYNVKHFMLITLAVCCIYIGDASVKGVDGVSLNVPHGVFLVKKPKLATSSFENNQPSITTGLQLTRNVFLPYLEFVLHGR